MSLLFRVLFAHKCSSTHHKLAMDALRHLDGPHAQKWRDLFLANIELYIEGSKAPDKKFKDFRNHVLHVQDNYWGGAVVATEKWFARTVKILRQHDWHKAVYAAGVLSHYYTDALMPLHTGQTEAEGAVHRAIEWGTARSYDELVAILEDDLGGLPDLETPESDDWLALMTIHGAEAANSHYATLVDHYDIRRGSKKAELGFDQDCKDCLARMLGHARIGLSRILSRAFREANVEPPESNVTLKGYLTTVTIPVFWITRKLADNRDKAAVRAIARELEATGRVNESLPEDDRAVRRLHAKEVLGVSVEELNRQPTSQSGTKHGTGTSPRQSRKARRLSEKSPQRKLRPGSHSKNEKRRVDRGAAEITGSSDSATRQQAAAGAISVAPEPKSTRAPGFHLTITDDVVDAPSIGPKTAKRLNRVGIETVKDLLDADPDKLSASLKVDYITIDTVLDWQYQARLVCLIPGIRGHDAQIMVACGITEPESLLAMQPPELLDFIDSFVNSSEGKRILRSSSPPDLEEVTNWISWASQVQGVTFEG